MFIKTTCHLLLLGSLAILQHNVLGCTRYLVLHQSCLACKKKSFGQGANKAASQQQKTDQRDTGGDLAICHEITKHDRHN